MVSWHNYNSDCSGIDGRKSLFKKRSKIVIEIKNCFGQLVEENGYLKMSPWALGNAMVFPPLI